MFVHGFGLVELALALEIQGQVVHVAHHRVAHGDTAEPVKRHVELALALQSKAHHAVGFGRLFVRLQFARLRHQEPLRRQGQVPDRQQHGGQHQLDPGGSTRQQPIFGTQHGHEQHQRDDRRHTCR